MSSLFSLWYVTVVGVRRVVGSLCVFVEQRQLREERVGNYPRLADGWTAVWA